MVPRHSGTLQGDITWLHGRWDKEGGWMGRSTPEPLQIPQRDQLGCGCQAHGVKDQVSVTRKSSAHLAWRSTSALCTCKIEPDCTRADRALDPSMKVFCSHSDCLQQFSQQHNCLKSSGEMGSSPALVRTPVTASVGGMAAAEAPITILIFAPLVFPTGSSRRKLVSMRMPAQGGRSPGAESSLT